MKVRQIRNATVLLDYGATKILADPMLAPQGSIPSLRYITKNRRKNPLVDLPDRTFEHLKSVTHVLITHCQKGHFDHLDRAGARWIRQNNVPVLSSAVDRTFLENKGLLVHSLHENQINSFQDGTITLVPCLHGEGIVGSLMAHGYGYIIKFPHQPTVYVVGDSILTPEIEKAISIYQPDVVIMPGGGAQFDIGGEIIMSAKDIQPISEISKGKIIVNHLEALDHCPTTRAEVNEYIHSLNVQHRVFAPPDGEELEF